MKKKNIFIMKKKIFFFDAVGWKSYCSRLWSWAQGAGRWAARRVRAGRAWQASVSGRGAQGRGACRLAGAGGRPGAQGRSERRRAGGSARGRRKRGRAGRWA